MTFLHQQIDQKLEQEKNWALRRQLGIPNNKRLWILACMDERFPIERALGLNEGDAHVFRNAGGLVTDDAIRSAMLTTQFFGTKEIIVVTHTECGIMTASGDLLTEILKNKGIKVDQIEIDPSLPELQLPKGLFSTWIKTFTDVDAITIKQVELLRQSPLIPDDVVIHCYVWEVENQRLRRPYEHLSKKVNTAEEMGAKIQSTSQVFSEVN